MTSFSIKQLLNITSSQNRLDLGILELFCSNKWLEPLLFYSNNNVLQRNQTYLMKIVEKKYLYFFCLIDYIYQSRNFHQISFVPFIVSVNSKL